MEYAKKHICMANQLLATQLRLAGHLARADTHDPLRIVCLQPSRSTLLPRQVSRGLQKAGYKHYHLWWNHIMQQINQDDLSKDHYHNSLCENMMNRDSWRDLVRRRCSGPHSLWRF